MVEGIWTVELHVRIISLSKQSSPVYVFEGLVCDTDYSVDIIPETSLRSPFRNADWELQVSHTYQRRGCPDKVLSYHRRIGTVWVDPSQLGGLASAVEDVARGLLQPPASLAYLGILQVGFTLRVDLQQFRFLLCKTRTRRFRSPVIEYEQYEASSRSNPGLPSPSSLLAMAWACA